jgi:hypothetical protein
MNSQEIAALLSKLAQYSLEWDNGGYMSSQHMVKQEGYHGDYISIDELAAAFGLVNSFEGKFEAKP